MQILSIVNDMNFCIYNILLSHYFVVFDSYRLFNIKSYLKQKKDVIFDLFY